MKRVVIVGGGFGGVSCARALRQRLPAQELAIVLCNRENHLVFHPLLPEVAGGSIQPDAVAAPLRQMLPGVFCRSEEVTAIDLEKRSVTYDGLDGRPGNLTYDHLVIACGTQVNLGGVRGLADHAFPLKTLGDAIALRAHVMEQMERAEVAARAMVPNPLAIRTSDSSLVAAETLRDHGLKSLPVVEEGNGGRLAGYVRVERLMEVVLGSR